MQKQLQIPPSNLRHEKRKHVEVGNPETALGWLVVESRLKRWKQFWRSSVALTVIELMSFSVISGGSGCSSPSDSPAESGRWVSLGLAGKNIYRIKTTRSNVYACALQDGLYRMPVSSGEGNWETLGLANSSGDIEGITDVVVSPANENELIASRQVHKSNLPGIFKSIDGGVTWVEADSGFGFQVPWWYPADSGRYTSGQVLFNLAGQFDLIYAGGSYDDGIYRSTNSGLSWQEVVHPNLLTFSHVSSIAEGPTNTIVIYVGGKSSSDGASSMRPAWLIKSTAAADSAWETVLPTMTDQVYFANVVGNICICDDPRAIYLGMRGFVLGSGDEGKTWTKLLVDGNHESNVFTVVVSPKNGRHLVAANGAGFFESLDGGSTWHGVDAPASGMVGRLHWDKNTDNLYAVHGDRGGVYVLPNASSGPITDIRRMGVQ